MLKLHGFSSSNYYNIVKLTLLEKRIEFEEILVYTGAGDTYRPDYLGMSPQGKVPCLETSEGFLSESRCIVTYLEDVHPDPPLYPSSPFARAKVAEVTQVLDLYFDLPARRLLPNLFRQTKPPEKIANEVRDSLAKTTKALGRLVKFDSYLLGDRFSAADVSAIIHFAFARLVAKNVLDFDPFEDLPGAKDYLKRMGERETVQRVRADQNADFPRFVEHLQRMYSASVVTARAQEG